MNISGRENGSIRGKTGWSGPGLRQIGAGFRCRTGL